MRSRSCASSSLRRAQDCRTRPYVLTPLRPYARLLGHHAKHLPCTSQPSASSMLAARPAARPPLSPLQPLARDAYPPRPRLRQLRVAHPAYVLVACQRRDAPPGAHRRRAQRQHPVEVRGEIVHDAPREGPAGGRGRVRSCNCGWRPASSLGSALRDSLRHELTSSLRCDGHCLIEGWAFPSERRCGPGAWRVHPQRRRAPAAPRHRRRGPPSTHLISRLPPNGRLSSLPL